MPRPLLDATIPTRQDNVIFAFQFPAQELWVAGCLNRPQSHIFLYEDFSPPNLITYLDTEMTTWLKESELIPADSIPAWYTMVCTLLRTYGDSDTYG